MKNKIEIQLKGESPITVSRYGTLIKIVLDAKGLDVMDGQTILHWKNGILEVVELRLKPYRRKALDKVSG